MKTPLLILACVALSGCATTELWTRADLVRTPEFGQRLQPDGSVVTYEVREVDVPVVIGCVALTPLAVAADLIAGVTYDLARRNDEMTR